MEVLEVVAFALVLLGGAALVAAILDDRSTEPQSRIEQVVRSAHDRTDDYELERVRSMLRRR